MPQIIAGLYEIEKRIGAGGGGIVYLGRHIRLNKQIVLKADRRTLNIGTEALRREVDLLKKLSHTYIPQVYDFVQEEGVVYTVMDYIEGESLDKLLAHGQLPGQARLVGWACQLLEALIYLHSQPPYGILHGDIKPANIMLRSDGSICLIDFNIALALGEDGAVKVGFSRGYASPEHYGADYLAGNQAAAVGSASVFKSSRFFRLGSGREGSEKTLSGDGSEETVLADGSEKTVLLAERKAGSMCRPTASGSASDGGRGILLDVRSDIYSLGATLYHVLSGRKPPQDAREVEPLGPEVCSLAVSAILQKAMAPQPRDRYQTAEDMLADFWRLHRQDKRAVKHRRRMAGMAAALAGVFLAGGCCAFIGLRQLEQRQSALALAEYSANALAEGDVDAAVRQALEAMPRKKSIFDGPVTAEAQKALTDALGVYDLSEGFKALNAIRLPGAPFHVCASPKGTRLAVVYAYEAAVYEIADQRKLAALPIQKSALSDCLFVDEGRIVYAGAQGVTVYDLERGKALWTGDPATTLALSGDRRLVAAVNRDEDRVIVYSTADGEKVWERSFDGLHLKVPANDIFADAEDDIFALDEDGDMLAVSFHNGGLYLLDLQDSEEDLILYEESDYRHFEGGFCGRYFAFTAEKSDEAVFGLVDVPEAFFAGGFSSAEGMVLQADENGIYLAGGGLLTEVELDTLEEREIAYTAGGRIIGFCAGSEYTLVATENQGYAFYDSGAHRMFDGKDAHQLSGGGNGALATDSAEDGNYDFDILTDAYGVLANRNEPLIRLMTLEKREETQLMSYDARYVHDEARVSLDGKTVMLFGYRSFRIYDMSGAMVAEAELPDADHIYDQQFRRSEEGSWLEVIWYDGTRRRYSAADGSLLWEETGEAPSKDLYEEFFTDQYKIVSSLHGAPEVYDRDSGRLVAILERDSYLTYVTQLADYIVTEYISSTGERYGILLDDRLQKLAYLPRLCDVAGDRLIFDYQSGNLRQCKVYSLQELIALGEARLED